MPHLPRAWRALALTGSVFLFNSAQPAGADVRRRWYVDFDLGVPREEVVLPLTSAYRAKNPTAKPGDEVRRVFLHNKPTMFQYQDRLGGTTVCWFVLFTLHNPIDQYVPIQADVMLHTDQGKDYHQDVVRVDPEVIARGKFYSSVLQAPDMELKIVTFLERMGGLNPAIQRERLNELKRENRYLNCAELRRKQVLKPGEEITALAIFPDVDRNTDSIELLVSGLWDVVKVEKVEPTRTHYVYENKVLHYTYDFPGDEFNRIVDFVSPRLPRVQRWEILPVGPAGDKETLAKLIEALEKDDPPPDPGSLGQVPVITYGPVLRRGANEALKALTSQDFGYEPVKSPKENLASIRLWKEWWTRNQEKLIHNDRLMRFESQPQVIPGQVEVKPPYAK